MLDHVNKIKTHADQFACLEEPVKYEDIVLTLLENLLALYEILDYL
jgi:hypothetical protein